MAKPKINEMKLCLHRMGLCDRERESEREWQIKKERMSNVLDENVLNLKMTSCGAFRK